jgi:hypothetical protein
MRASMRDLGDGTQTLQARLMFDACGGDFPTKIYFCRKDWSKDAITGARR